MRRRKKRKIPLKRRLQCYMAWTVLILAVLTAIGALCLMVWGVKNACVAIFQSEETVQTVEVGNMSIDKTGANQLNELNENDVNNAGNIYNVQSRSESLEDSLILLVNKEHSLPENYQVDLHLLKNGQSVSEVMYEDLRDMIFTGEEEVPGLSFIVASGYRTSEMQQELLDEEIEKNMLAGMNEQSAYADALESVAPAGHSEHETGLCVDIVAESNQRMDETQQYTEENKWLREHCAEYGFILRYPAGKEVITGYMYESWHFRYVGKEAAKEITEQGITLEEYLE